VGAFLGIRRSFSDPASAESFIRAIDIALAQIGLSGYHEPVALPNPYHHGYFGRSALDHQSANLLQALASAAGPDASHLALLYRNPFRVAYLPFTMPRPLETAYRESIGGKPESIWVGSAPALKEELVALAPALDIPLEGENVSNQIAQSINEAEPESDEQEAWLLLYEGARLALENGVALSLAG